jgi:hypothetical protein
MAVVNTILKTNLKHNEMREIKFKAKRVDGKGWVFSDSILLNEEVCDLKEAGDGEWVKVDCRMEHSLNCDNTNMWVQFERDTLCQFTGLQDKNGNDIYEGDTIYGEFVLFDQIVVVKYERGTFRLIGNHKDKYKKYYSSLHEFLFEGTLRYCKGTKFDGITTVLEITGNIHN